MQSAMLDLVTKPPFFDLQIFIATSADRVPESCSRFYSVDGSVPGAVMTWDHHVSGEPINLDAMPNVLDPSKDRVDGVGSTNADADALCSVVAVLFGGKSRIRTHYLSVMASASHWCDHLTPHPSYDEPLNRLGRGLLDSIAEQLADGPWMRISERFAEQSRLIASLIAEGQPLPYSNAFERNKRVAEQLMADGRITEHGPVALFDLRNTPHVDPSATYALTRCPVALSIENHPRGGNKYTVGINPTVTKAPRDLSPLLASLAAQEWNHGAPALGPEPIPKNENWGGRATVFGSPWNYGSRLKPEQVLATIQEWIARTANR